MSSEFRPSRELRAGAEIRWPQSRKGACVRSGKRCYVCPSDFSSQTPPVPGGNYVSFVVQDRSVFLAGVISTWNGELITGTVGTDKSIRDGYEAARACPLIQLANLKVALGDLDRLQRIISLNGYVNAVPGFAESPQVINGASDLLVELFGSRGLHTRAAIGVSALPKNALVEFRWLLLRSNDK